MSWRTAVLLALPVLVALACSGGAGGAPKATTAPGTPAGAATSAGAATAASTLPAAATRAPVVTAAPLVLGSGPFNLPDASAHLADLASYQATLTLSFAGASAGASQKWSKTYVMLSAQSPAMRQLTVARSGDLPDLTATYIAEANGLAYEVRGQNSCTAAAFKPGASPSQALEPAGLLTGVIGADAAGGPEPVNGVAANHYTFDEHALGLLNMAKATGELWVAADGGYLVKYLLTTTGGADYFGADTTGILTWDYELTQVNQPVALTLPADCPAGLVLAPRLPDAANVQDLPGSLVYDSATSLAEAVTFYQTQLPPLGWALTGDPVAVADLPADQTSVILDFAQADQTLTVVLTHGDSGTQVRLAQAGVQK
jgi:hypothetical protein